MAIIDDLDGIVWTSFGIHMSHNTTPDKANYYAVSGLTFEIADKGTGSWPSEEIRPMHPDGTPVLDGDGKPVVINSTPLKLNWVRFKVGGSIPSGYPPKYKDAYQQATFWERGDCLISSAITIPESPAGLSVAHVITVEEYQGSKFMRQRSFWSDGQVGDYGCCP